MNTSLPQDVGHSLSALPEGFVDLADWVPDAIVDMRYYGSDNFVATPVDGYCQPKAILTRPAARALQSVQSELANSGLGLKIFDAYRPQRAVDHFLRWTEQPEDAVTTARFHPGFSKPELFSKGYLAARSSHTRGSTLDLTLVWRDGSEHGELDMGTEFDFFGARSAVHCVDISPVQRAHRLLLQLIMERHGFMGFEMEWWHFTLKNEPYPHQYFDFPVG